MSPHDVPRGQWAQSGQRLRAPTFIDQLQTALQSEGGSGRTILAVLLIKNRASGRPDAQFL